MFGFTEFVFIRTDNYKAGTFPSSHYEFRGLSLLVYRSYSLQVTKTDMPLLDKSLD